MSQSRSQIHRSPLSLRKSQNPKRSKSVFVACLEEAGLNISQNEEPHVLRQEQSLFVRDLEKILVCSENNHQEFLKGMKKLCDRENQFRKALEPTNLRKEDSNQTTEKIEQECLFRLFLKVPIVQTEAIEFLLEEITTTASEVEEDTSWLHMLLNPLRYLPYIKNPKTLAKKLLDILEIATHPAQLEILDSIPEVIPDEEYTEMARELSKLLDANDEISGGIVDCLNALNLDPAIRLEVQEKILENISGGSNLNTFPVFLSFLMTDCKSENLVRILLKIRNALEVMLVSDNTKGKESCKILIFNKLQSDAIKSKLISDAWLNMISMIKVHSEHRSIDYLILFMIHSCVQFKKRIIEAIFKKRVREGVFKIGQLEKLFEKALLQQFLKDYFKSIVEIGCSLIRSSSDQIVVDYSTILFQQLFSHKYTEVIYQREILDKLVTLAGASDKRTVGTVLKIISSLERDILKRHATLLMRLLEKLDTLELKDAKEVFEILCSLTCAEDADESMSGLRNEIHMIVRKQLFSSKRPIKHRGIISAVVMAKYIAKTSVPQEGELPADLTSVNKLPHGPAREAASILELISTLTKSCSELTGLYYDQFASILVFNYSQFEKHFLEWGYQTILIDFKKIFVVNHIPHVPNNDMDMSMQYSLRSSSSPEKSLGINIAGYVLSNCPKIMILSSHFRLLRLLHYRLHNGDLSDIDALLGAPVILPNVQIDELEPDQARIVADCLFHCANWFREIISGYVTQPNKKLRARVVRRLEDLLEVEKKLKKCMELIPEHKLPVSYFDSVMEIGRQNNQQIKSDKPKGNPRKRLKVADPNETANTQAAPTQAAPTQSKKKTTFKHSVSSEHAVHFREIDADIILLIRYPLVFNDDLPDATQTASLSIDQLKFILRDFVDKERRKNQGLSQLDMVAPIEINSDGVFILPHIDAHLKVMVKKIDELLLSSDGVLDSPEMFMEEATDYKTCFGLILEAFYLIFSKVGFQQSRNLEVLKELLKSMRKDSSQPNSAHLLITDFINTVSEYSERCLELSHAVHLVQLMEALYSATTPNPETKKKIVSVANKLLSRRWYNSKGQVDNNGRNCKLNLDILLKTYLSSANVNTLGGLVATLQNQAFQIQSKEDSLPMLRSIDKTTFHVLYNALCSALHNRVKSEVQCLTNSQHLALWDTTAVTMQNLMSIAKAQETRTNLVCFLKKSIGILKIFMTHGIPILEIMLRSRSEEVVAVFKAIQTSTRFLHHLCCYSKLTKDTSLMAFVPKFRLVLETLVYRVKAALAANNCMDAFWLGNLRNRNLQGEDILSQASDSTVQTDETNENDELPDDDSDNTSDILNEDGSDVFD